MIINLAETVGYNAHELVKVKEATLLIEKVINSEEFKYNVLNYTQKNGKIGFHFRKTIFGKNIDYPYTNQEVFDMIMLSKEHAGNKAPHQMDLYLHLLAESNDGVVGYGNADEKEIYTYNNWFNIILSTEEYAGHIVHEWTHKLGFDHAFGRFAPNRDNSVPYAIGELVVRLAKK